MTQNLRNQLKTESKRAKILSRQAVDAMKTGNFNLGRGLMKEAAMAGKKCQVLLHEIQQAKISS